MSAGRLGDGTLKASPAAGSASSIPVVQQSNKAESPAASEDAASELPSVPAGPSLLKLGAVAAQYLILSLLILVLRIEGVSFVRITAIAGVGFIFHHFLPMRWRLPFFSLLSLAGIPLTVGFIGKFYLVLAGVESGLWLLLAALIVGSGIGLYYYLRIVYRMLLPEPEQAPELRQGTMAFPVVLVTFLLLIVLGVYPASLMSLIEAIAL